MVERSLAIVLGLIGLAASTGCGSSYTAVLSGVTPMPDGSSLEQTGGHLHSGIATAFTPLVTMSNTWGTHSETDSILVSTSDPGVLQVAQVTGNTQGYGTGYQDGSGSGDSNGGRWVVWAIAPGVATLTVMQSGNVALTVQVEVTDPP